MADNWGADFWGAYADVSKAHAMKQLFEQQQAGKQAFGQAMTDPNIFLPGVPQGGPQMGGGGGGAAPPNIRDMINTTSQKYGLDPSLLTNEARIESGFNPNASNKSGARGLFEFMPKTAQQYGLSNPMDAGASTDAAARLAVANRDALTRGLGRQPTNGEIYLAHQQGAAGALKLLQNPDAPAASLIGAKAVVQNGGRPDMTAGQFSQMWLGKFAQSGAHGAPAPGGPQQQGGGQPQQAGMGMGGGAGQLSWPHIVQAIMAKNPHLDPKALAEAVDLFQPLMSQQSQMDWKQQSLMLREQGLQQQQEIASERDQLRQQQIDNQASHQQATEQQQAQNEQGRNERADKKDQGIQKRFDITQDRLAKGLQLRLQDFQEKTRHNQATEGTAKEKMQRDYDLRQRKALNDQLHQRVMEMAATSNAVTMPSETKKKILADEMTRYTQEQADIEAAKNPGATQTTSPAGASPAAAQPSAAAPQELKSANELKAAVAKGALPVGTKYNGYTYKGGDPLDPKSWAKGDAKVQKSSAVAPSKPLIDFQTPSAMGKPESLMQAFFGG